MCLESPLRGLRVMEEGAAWEAQEGGRAGERERQLGCPLVSCWGSDPTHGLSGQATYWPFPSSFCFQLHSCGEGGVHWYQHGNLYFTKA